MQIFHMFDSDSLMTIFCLLLLFMKTWPIVLQQSLKSPSFSLKENQKIFLLYCLSFVKKKKQNTTTTNKHIVAILTCCVISLLTSLICEEVRRTAEEKLLTEKL